MVETLYRNQPSATRWYDDYIETFRDEMVECLEDEGVGVDHNAPMREIISIDADVFARRGSAENCAFSTGLLEGLSQ